MKKIFFLLILLFVVVIVAGCKSHFHLPILLDGPNTADQAFDVNVVVAPNGMKHFFWVDCANVDGHCYFSHKRTYTGDSTVDVCPDDRY